MANNKKKFKESLKDFFLTFLNKFGYIAILFTISYTLGFIQGATLGGTLKDLAVAGSTINYNNRYYCDINNKNIKYIE